MRKLLLCAALCFASAALALVPGKQMTQYGHDTWTLQHGLPGASVFSIAQTRDGYLWLRTSSGLVRFDGITFVQRTPIVDGQRVDETVRAINVDADGDLLIRTRSEALEYKDQTFRRLLTGEIPGGVDRFIYLDAAQRLWIGADSDLYFVRGNKIESVVQATGNVNTMLDDEHGGVWIGASSGLYHYDGQTMTTFVSGTNSSMVAPQIPSHPVTPGTPDAALATIGSPSSIIRDHEGAMWIGSHDGLFRYKDGVLTAVPELTGPNTKPITAVYEDRHHTLWVATIGFGLYRETDGKWSTFREAQGLTDDNVLSICEDREGSLWVGTVSGLDRFKDTPVTPFGIPQGLPSEDVCGIVRGLDGTMYVYDAGSGVAEFRNGKLGRVYDGKDGIEVNAADKLLVGHDGTIWVGTPNGVVSIKDGHATKFMAHDRLKNMWISAVGEDEESVFIGTGELTIMRLKNDVATPFTIDGQPTPFAKRSTYIFTFLRDDDGTIWAGTTNGLDLPGSLYRMRHHPYSVVRVPTVDFSVTGIYDDHRGNLWLTGDTRGLVRMNKKTEQVFRYTKAQGLLSDDVNCVISDRHGDFWMGTTIGIMYVKGDELDAVAAGTRAKVKPVLFDTNDGMRTSETSSNRSQPGVCLDAKGRVWFGTPKGVAIIDPDNIGRNPAVPPVVIENVVANGTEMSPLKPLTLKAGTERVEFQYNALSLLVPTRVKFKYRLDGYDTDWVDAGTRRAAFYTRLAPGDYTFRVIACNNDGVWNETGASVAFTLEPLFYQTKWFAAACAAAVLVLFWAGHRWRLRQLTVRQRELERTVEERTRSLADEINVRKAAEAETERIHKELLIASHRAGMAEMATAVLHNVGNTLNSIGVSGRLMMQSVARSRVSALQRIADLLTQNSGNMAEFLTTNPKGKLVPQYVIELSKELGAEQSALGNELSALNTHVEELGKFVAMQQTYARASGPTHTVTPKELIEEAIKANAGVIARTGVRVTSEVQANRPIRVDQPKALQIIADLVANAVEATASAGGANKVVEIAVTESNNAVTFRIVDHGVGIPPENLSKIFNSGFTTKVDGHGFSLHSGILAARQMGGDLRGSSAGAGQGATFSLSLPVNTPAEATAAARVNEHVGAEA